MAHTTYTGIEPVKVQPKGKIDKLTEQAVFVVLLMIGAVKFLKEARAKRNE